MVIALGHIYAQIPSRERVRELMLENQAAAREQPGCVSFTFAETIDDPGHYVVVEEWSDRRALEAHYASRATTDYEEQVAELLLRDSEVWIHVVQESFAPQDSAPMDPRRAD